MTRTSAPDVSPQMRIEVDVNFDFRADTPLRRDPDAFSATLRRYHSILWGRPLPNGRPFILDASWPITSRYLHHKSDLGEFVLSSDSVIPTFTRWKRMQHIVGQFSEAVNESFRSIAYTIGSMMIWPRASTNGQRSINVQRGFNSKICDRMVLTVECIRRYNAGGVSPLSAVLDANSAFFGLFENFDGFINHFLLQDLVTEDKAAIRFFLPFDDFRGPARPTDVPSYLEYKRRTMDFIHARNDRVSRLTHALRL